MTLTYDSNGNITSKTGIGNYSYSSSSPYAVTGVSNTTGLVSTATQSLTYNGRGKILTASDNGYLMTFTYGPDDERWKSALKQNGSTIRTSIYAGDYEKITEGGVTRQFYYLPEDIILVKTGNTAVKTYYAITDNLGSYVHIFDGRTSIVYNAEYDAWGQQNVITNTIGFHRGYTGHEMMLEFGLINMNGRLYDPLLGRFLSPDNYVQLPDFSQNFNRYSYCLNNPLIYKDDNGEFMHLIIGAVIGGFINSIVNARNISNFWQALGYFGVGATAGALSAGVGAGVDVAMAGGSFGAGFMGTVAGVSSTGFVSGALAGATSGFVGGIISNSGNTWMSGSNFREGLLSGIKAGGIGALTGGAIGGVIGGIDALTKGTNFWTGTKNIDLSQYAASGFIPDELKAKIINAKYVGEFEDASVFEAKWLNESGATIPELGIIVEKGIYTSGSDVGRELLQHEYGHILQYKKVGAKAFYSVITPESVASASYSYISPSYNHDSYWTETWANYLSKQYFGANWLGGNYGRIAQPLSTINRIRLTNAQIFLNFIW